MVRYKAGIMVGSISGKRETFFNVLGLLTGNIFVSTPTTFTIALQNGLVPEAM